MTVTEAIYEQEVQLLGMLAEFRIALRSEIEAARRGEANAAVPLVNGRRLAQIGASFQYLFELENGLNLPSDTPGDLYVPGLLPLQMEVIAVNGMAITLRVFEDIGTFVPVANLRSNLAHLMRKLIERIENRSGQSTPVADRILGKAPITGQPIPYKNNELNDEQRRAVASTLGFNATFLNGPPGTGKTMTIGIIGLELYRQHRSVLLVSHTNTAVDQALLAIGKNMQKYGYEDDLKVGRIIRVGDPSDQRLCEQYPDLLAHTHVERRSSELITSGDALKYEKDSAVSKLFKLSHDIDLWEWVQEAREGIEEMECAFDELIKTEDVLHHKRQMYAQLIEASSYWANALAMAKHIKIVLSRIEKLQLKLEEAKS